MAGQSILAPMAPLVLRLSHQATTTQATTTQATITIAAAHAITQVPNAPLRTQAPLLYAVTAQMRILTATNKNQVLRVLKAG
jgi:hypothetical protein